MKGWRPNDSVAELITEIEAAQVLIRGLQRSLVWVPALDEWDELARALAALERAKKNLRYMHGEGNTQDKEGVPAEGGQGGSNQAPEDHPRVGNPGWEIRVGCTDGGGAQEEAGSGGDDDHAEAAFQG